jgi:tetratricopeptide (TPR) repeat protein
MIFLGGCGEGLARRQGDTAALAHALLTEAMGRKAANLDSEPYLVEANSLLHRMRVRDKDAQHDLMRTLSLLALADGLRGRSQDLFDHAKEAAKVAKDEDFRDEGRFDLLLQSGYAYAALFTHRYREGVDAAADLMERAKERGAWLDYLDGFSTLITGNYMGMQDRNLDPDIAFFRQLRPTFTKKAEADEFDAARFEVMAALSNYYNVRTDIPKATEWANSSLELAASLPSSPAKRVALMQAHFRLGLAYHSANDLRRALDEIDQCLRLSPALACFGEQASLEMHLGRV